MFIRMYILSFLRNIMIFLFITPFLTFYMLTLVYRVPNYDKEQLLDYIVETGDMTALKSPTKEYKYFFANVDSDGNILFISDTDDLPNEKKRFIDVSIDMDYNNRKITRANVLPEDKSFHHYPIQEHYFSSKRTYDKKTTISTYHVIYNVDQITFAYNMQQARRANYITMAGASIISLFFAFLEVRPTKIAWDNQKRFIANISHELRTPITVISTVLEEEEGDIDSVKNRKRIMRNEAELLSNMVNQLMFLSRADAKQIKVQKEPVDVYTLVMEMYINAEVPGSNKSIQFEELVCDDIIANVDDTLIRQLIRILLANAVEYTPEGGKISLVCRKKGSKIEITISDSGIGIDAKNKRKIFSRFYRVDNSQLSSNGNSGLGLAIAKWIVKKHNGTIRVESTVGKWSKFIIRLPIGRV